jgi:hypothetical protein
MKSGSVRFQESVWDRAAVAGNLLDEIYEDKVDVALLRGVFSPALMESAGGKLGAENGSYSWARPNQVSPPDDIYVLGSETPATPTFRAPRGASLEDYLRDATAHEALVSGIFGADFNVSEQVSTVLSRISAGRKVEVPSSADGRKYVPYTLRRLSDGRRISLHHDSHYKLALYSDLAPRLDTTTLVSFFVTLQSPESGGELVVYPLRSDDPAQPRLPNGHWDSNAIERDYSPQVIAPAAGDVVVLAAGRCFHRVQQVAGATARVTLGGFFALTRDRSSVLYWS